MQMTKISHDTMYLVHKKKYKIASAITSIAIGFSLDDTLFLKISESWNLTKVEIILSE
jgi:hypothetical protein